MDELLVYAEVTISLNVADTGNVLQATIDRLDAINNVLREQNLHAEILTSGINQDNVEVSPF